MAASVSAKKSTPDMPVFSYAQAAKGLTSSPSDTKQNKPDAGASSVDENTPDRKTPVTATPADQSSTQQSSEVVKNGPASADGEASAPAKTVVSERASPSLVPSTTSTLVKEDEISITPNGTASESEWEKQSQVSTAAEKEKASQATEDDKAKSEASWENVTPPPKELKAAPPPTVNIWQQRQEALEAKAKASALLKSAAAPATASKGSTTPNSTSQTSGDVRSEHYGKGGNRKKVSEASANPTDVSANGRDKKKSGDSSRKGGVRSNRGPETGESLPPVNDASSWPTPQIAQGEDMRKAQEQTEKPEKAEKEKHSGSRTHGKEKWMPVPYVPSAVFNTPLPPAARRGGRSARGGTREGGSRGAGHASGDRTTPTSASKASSAGDREKSDERAASETQKGTAAADASLKNGDVAEKHASTTATTDAQKDAKSAQNRSNAAAATNASEGNAQHSHPASSQSPTRPRQENKSYHKSHDAHTASYKGSEHHGSHASRQANSSADGHSGHSRYGANHEKRFEVGSRSGEFFKDSNYQPRDKEFNKDREYNKEGRDYQRSEYSNRDRESRSERGRGGYRGGRGGHSNYNNTSSNSQNAPYHSAPIPQHPFQPSKGFNFNERHRLQTNANGAQQQPQQQHNSSNNRMSMRSPSMPNPGMFTTPYPIQTDMSIMYPYPHAIPQGPMTAMPYQPFMENYSIMTTISMQLEYYFSVDNLCKDLFLRKHMDSQGYVLLSVIASFKRIKSLTEDLELLRFICRQLRNVEYRPSEDGVDRLRKREGWQQWVLNMEDRDPSAKNDGPSTATAEEYVPTSATAPPHMNGNGTYNNFVPTAETVSAEEAPKRQAKLSSAAPEFSPLAANGAGSFEQQANFTDGQVDSNPVAVHVGQ